MGSALKVIVKFLMMALLAFASVANACEIFVQVNKVERYKDSSLKQEYITGTVLEAMPPLGRGIICPTKGEQLVFSFGTDGGTGLPPLSVSTGQKIWVYSVYGESSGKTFYRPLIKHINVN